MATVTINRPAQAQRLQRRGDRRPAQAFETLDGADGVRVVFVTGAGETFSAGADLEWMREAADYTEADNREDAMRHGDDAQATLRPARLTVALVDGAAFGGGAGLVAACDMAIATERAKFAFSEVKLGLIAATISPYVVAAIGPRRARALFATGRVFDAAHAHEIGLVDQVVLDEATMHVVRDQDRRQEMMACGPSAVAESKRLVAHVDRPADRSCPYGSDRPSDRQDAGQRRGQGRGCGLSRAPKAKLGSAVIGSVLIANRGEIARRVIRTSRRLGVNTIAVYSEADARAAFVREADVAVEIGPAIVTESYLKLSGYWRRRGGPARRPSTRAMAFSRKTLLSPRR